MERVHLSDAVLLTIWSFLPLTQACENGHLRVARDFVRQGKDIEARDAYGQTPLTIACGKMRANPTSAVSWGCAATSRCARTS